MSRSPLNPPTAPEEWLVKQTVCVHVPVSYKGRPANHRLPQTNCGSRSLPSTPSYPSFMFPFSHGPHVLPDTCVTFREYQRHLPTSKPGLFSIPAWGNTGSPPCSPATWGCTPSCPWALSSVSAKVGFLNLQPHLALRPAQSRLSKTFSELSPPGGVLKLQRTIEASMGPVRGSSRGCLRGCGEDRNTMPFHPGRRCCLLAA